MAKSQPAPAIAEPSKPEPIIRVNWPKDAKGGDIKLTGDGHTALAPGQRVRIVIEGTVTGYSMAEWGCSIEAKGKQVKVEALGGGEASESMAETLERGRARSTKKEKGY